MNTTQRKNYTKGAATLELLISFTLLIMSITAVMLILNGGQSISVDTETNTEAISKAQKSIEDARALSRSNFLSVVSNTTTEISGALTYTKVLSISDISPCKKQATSMVSWLVSPIRPQKVELSTFFTDIAGIIAFGGDCATDSPSSSWDNPQRFASDTLSPGKPTSIDVLGRIAYLGIDTNPFLGIADTRTATLGQTSGLFVTFANGFSAGVTVNTLDVINDMTTGKRYVFAAMDTATEQLKVIDVTDIYNPVLVATSTLSGVDSSGSYPEGYRISYFKNRLYVITRETAGPEFHIFDVSDPTNPTELGSGTEFGITVNAIAVQERLIGGALKRFAYMATTQNTAELKVYDITDTANNGTITEIVAARQDLIGIQNGESVFLVGDKLYFGRQSAPSGDDLYVYDTSNPLAGLTLLGAKDIDTGVLHIRIAGRFAFLATSKVNKEFQVWNISNPAGITLIKEHDFGNIIENGFDYEPDFMYTTGQATPNFQILYSPPL